MRFKLLFILATTLLISQCKSSKESFKDDTTAKDTNEVLSDTITISNPEAAYDIIIIEPGFAAWLVTQQPMDNFTSDLLAIRNRTLVAEWNRRVQQPSRYNAQLYEQEINYFPNVDYGLEVNYKLFMYFRFFQKKYNQNLLQ